MRNSQVKVLYIVGNPRSGSTIDHRVLGQIDGFVSVGKLRNIWQYGLIENRRCTCGVPFLECEVWRRRLDKAFGGVEQIDAKKMVRLLKKTRTNFLLKYLGDFGKHLLTTSKIEEYLTNLEKLYQAIQSEAGSKVIVDSSKASWYGSTLQMLPKIDTYIVHVTRDPRGVGYSFLRRKIKGQSNCQWYNHVSGSISWNLKNIAVELFSDRINHRYLRIRYEDFVQKPELTVESLLSFVQEKFTHFSFKERNRLTMDVDHLFAGSPTSRADTGTVALQLDEKWKNELKQREKAIICNLTWPLLKKYGYL